MGHRREREGAGAMAPANCLARKHHSSAHKTKRVWCPGPHPHVHLEHALVGVVHQAAHLAINHAGCSAKNGAVDVGLK